MLVTRRHFMRADKPLSSMRTKLLLLSAVFCASIVANTTDAASPGRLLAEFRQAEAIIESSQYKCLLLNIFLAETPAQRAQGLMFVEDMDETEGMLFTYPRPASMTMWMKNTYIPLDMLFIRQDGTISSIAKRTEPLSTKRVSSTEPVTTVLELNAGFTDRWTIKPGNRLLTVN